MAVWALAKLLPGEQFRALASAQRAGEDDPTVREEWALA
jgi:hypothetical protein